MPRAIAGHLNLRPVHARKSDGARVGGEENAQFCGTGAVEQRRGQIARAPGASRVDDRFCRLSRHRCCFHCGRGSRVWRGWCIGSDLYADRHHTEPGRLCIYSAESIRSGVAWPQSGRTVYTPDRVR